MKNKEVTAYINNSSEDQIEILKELRELIFSIVPKVKEQYKWSRPVYALDKDFCYITTTKKHVTFGFFEFGKVETNKELLEGTGKQMRHVKINDLPQISDLKLSEMIREVLK